MRRTLMLAAVLLCACNREAPAPADAPAAPTVAPAEPVATAPPAQPPASAAQRPALTGEFRGTLPCAECEGVLTDVVFAADGSYRLTETLLGSSPDAPREEQGLWSASEDGRRVQLAVGDSEDARYFEIVSADELRLLDSSGNPIDDRSKNYSLKRVPPAP